MLDVPLAAHGCAAAFATLEIKQHPFPPARGLGADPRIVLPQASLQIGRPADIGSAILLPSASQHVNEKEFIVLAGPFRHGSIPLARGWRRPVQLAAGQKQQDDERHGIEHESEDDPARHPTVLAICDDAVCHRGDEHNDQQPIPDRKAVHARSPASAARVPG
jgi:hypothetical protein